jgi:hypothetical protein
MNAHGRGSPRWLIAVGVVLATTGLLGIAGCSDGAVDPQVQDRVVETPPPDPPESTANPSGIVYGVTTEGVQPLEGVAVWSFVFEETSGWTNGKVFTNARGEYSIGSGLPSSGTVVIYASTPGYAQPCVGLYPIDGATGARDIWLYSLPALDAPDMELPPDHSLLVSGLVHTREGAGGEPKPIAGARVTLDLFLGMGVVGARSRTNRNGEYVICSSPGSSAAFPAPDWPAVVQVTAPGFGGIILERSVEEEGLRVDFEF